MSFFFLLTGIINLNLTYVSADISRRRLRIALLAKEPLPFLPIQPYNRPYRLISYQYFESTFLLCRPIVFYFICPIFKGEVKHVNCCISFHGANKFNAI